MSCSWKRTSRTAVAVALLTCLLLVFGADVVAAHPLGNFTVNRYARVEVGGSTMQVHYVLDKAEVPTFVDIDQVRSDPDGFARRQIAEITGALELQLDGSRVDLRPAEHRLSTPIGEAGLPTLRLVVRFSAPLPAAADRGAMSARFSDHAEPDQLGWRELLVVARGEGHLRSSDAPARDLTDELRDYPEELLDDPLDRRAAQFVFTPGDGEVDPAPLSVSGDAAAVRAAGGLGGLMTAAPLSAWALAGVLAAAVGLGVVHGLGPGHGKTVMAAYLVDTRSRRRDALAIGVAVSLMHTASVLALGLAILYLPVLSPEASYPWLSFATGLAVTGVGLHLCRLRLVRGAALGAHAHAHPHHHIHAYPHHHGHAHSHDHGPAPAGNGPLSWRGLLALATAGGLLPSPSAVLVLLAAVSLGRVGLGLTLIAAFSVGLAAVLTGVGLALLYGRGVVERRHGRRGGRGARLLALTPKVSAVAMVAVGVVLTANATLVLLP